MLEVVLRVRNGGQWVECMEQAGMIIVTRPRAGAGAGGWRGETLDSHDRGRTG